MDDQAMYRITSFLPKLPQMSALSAALLLSASFTQAATIDDFSDVGSVGFSTLGDGGEEISGAGFEATRYKPVDFENTGSGFVVHQYPLTGEIRQATSSTLGDSRYVSFDFASHDSGGSIVLARQFDGSGTTDAYINLNSGPGSGQHSFNLEYNYFDDNLLVDLSGSDAFVLTLQADHFSFGADTEVTFTISDSSGNESILAATITDPASGPAGTNGNRIPFVFEFSSLLGTADLSAVTAINLNYLGDEAHDMLLSDFSTRGSVTVTAPEPGSLALLTAILIGLGWRASRPYRA